MDETIRKPELPTNPQQGAGHHNMTATIRVDNPQRTSAVTSGNNEVTVKPGSSAILSEEPGSDDFVLKGRIYRCVRCISDNSGEAQVFLVLNDEGTEMVLKIYYPNFTIKKTLMRIIQNFNLEMIVKIIDYGKTYVDGKNRDYELMEYLRGGTLSDYDLDGDFNQFRRIALQAAAALAYCHQNNVIHKDIKPGNYFFRDTKHKEIVLGDFGISSVMENDEKVHRTTQARTPVYAAPEMYNDVIDDEVEITPAVDFYALGITLMTLWMGENPLSQNERVMMRKKNEGRLPRINELPERVKMIVQGLTAVNPQSRWGYEEVERWFLGEDVDVDITSPLLKYRSFVVDPERNLVADNVHELIPLLLDNERLSCSYLYNGRIAGWLEQCGNVKLSSAVKDIVVNRYPADQLAGLMAAIYVMEPTYPYEDIKGNKCDDIHSVAISVLSYQEDYALSLVNPNDRLFLYLESHTKADVNRLRSYFPIDKKFDGRVAVLRLVYEIDREIPFLAKFPSSTVEEISHSFGYENCSDDEWDSLTDGRLLSWMYCREDNMACEALRIMIQDQKPTRSLAYKVLYNLDREAAYDLREANTPYQVGEVMARQLIGWQSLDDVAYAEKLSDFSDPNGRFFYFAQLHGWIEEISQARACFDLKSEENRDRLGAYDLRTAAYRFCRILGAMPSYQLEDGTILKTPQTIDKLAYRPQLLAAMKRGSLCQWMSVFYHEDPHNEFIETYSYEHKLEEWLNELGEIDAHHQYYRRFCDARKQTANKYQEVRQSYFQAKRKEQVWRGMFFMLCGAWLLLIIIFGVPSKDYVLQHPMLTIGLPVGGAMALIMASRAYFRGYGVIISSLWGLTGYLSSWLPVMALRYVNGAFPSMFVPAIVVITLIYILICHFTDYRSVTKSDSQLVSEVMDDHDIKSTLLEPLYFTFKQKSYRFKGSKFGLLDDVSNQVRSISGESVIHYILWSLMVGLLVVELVVFSPNLLNINKSDIDKIKVTPTAVDQIKNNDAE
jgi:serine/threonine protein kinase